MAERCNDHSDYDKRLREAEQNALIMLERAKENKIDIGSAFEYLKGLTEGQKAIERKLDHITVAQQRSTVDITTLVSKIDLHLVDYATVKEEFNDFRWFRDLMNGANKKLFKCFSFLLIFGILYLLLAAFLKEEVMPFLRWLMGIPR